MKQYYYVDKGGARLGPIPLEEMPLSEITPETLVWCKGMEKWQKAKAVEDFQLILSQKVKAEVVEPASVPQSQKPKDVPQTESPLVSASSVPKKGNGIVIGLVVTIVVLVGLLAVLLFTKEDSDTYSSVPKRIDATASYSDNQVAETQNASTVATAQAAAEEDDALDDDEPQWEEEFQPDGFDFVCEREVTAADLSGLSKADLRIMRNWIYARHGYKFKSKDLQDYFGQFDWYSPRYTDVTSQLSAIEKNNVEFIKRHE